MATEATLPKWIGPYRNRVVDLRVMPVSELLDNPRNWRKHPRAQESGLDAVMRQVGVIDVVRYNEPTGRLLDGHLRKKLFSADPATPVVVLVTDLSEEEEAVALATFDPLAGMARADSEALQGLLRAVAEVPTVQDDETLSDVLRQVAKGYGLAIEDDVPEPEVEIDRAGELQEKWQTARGQVWEIPSATLPGRKHRLMCGDSTNADDVERLMAGERAALLVTDPPYNVGVDYGEEVNDAKSEEEYNAFCIAWFGNWRAVSERQVVTPGTNNLASWIRLFEKPHFVAPWIKGFSTTRGSISVFSCQEPIVFYGRGWKRQREKDVFDYPLSIVKSISHMHPCPKSLPLWIDLIENYTERWDVVADAFLGSGTTAVAAEQVGRICYGMELEPKYAAVTLQRLADMGLEPRLE